MSISINIGGTIINFPSSGQSPNWSEAVIEFAQAVESALQGIVGPFDIAPQIYTMTSNVNTDIDVSNLAFPTSQVRGAFIRYSVFRTTTTNTVSESGNLIVTYNPDAATNEKWAITRDFVGDADITFSITDVGQVTFSTTSLAGASHTGAITYTAQALLQG